VFRRALITSIALCLVIPLGGVVNAAPPSPATDLAMAAARPSDPVDYAYDAAGRLIGVSQTNTGANTGRYNYDDSGNLLSIDRFASTTLSILSTVPARASVGSTITLSGTAFGATPAANTVKFNGTTATVSAATTRTLTVAVPTGATTGPITVTTSAGTATSAKPFTVDAASLPPTISAFSPALAAAGGTVTITGTGFDTTPATNVVSIGKTRAVVTAATATSLTVTVPDAAGSGPLTVVTPGGSVSTSTEFVAVPKGYAATDVATTPTIAVDGATTSVSVPTANKVSVLHFTGTKGQRLSLGLTGSTITTDFAITGFTPFGAPFGRNEYSRPWMRTELAGGIELAPLPYTGVYQFVIDPVGTGTGAVTATLSSRITGAVNPTGTATRVTLGRAGQLAELTFPATAGKGLHLGFTASTFPAGITVSVAVREPNGSWLIAPNGDPLRRQVRVDGGGDVDWPTSQTGNYTVVVGSSDQSTGAVNITGSTDFDAGTVTLGDDSTVSTGRPGQDIDYRYAGTAGQALSLDFTAYNYGFFPQVTVFAPDGSTVVTALLTSLHLDVPALPVTGTYTIAVSPFSSDSGLMTLRLTVRQDVGTLSATGAATAVTLSQPGRTASLQFTGTAGQAMSFGFTNWTLPAGRTLRAQIVDSQGAVLFKSLSVQSLASFWYSPAATGTYRLLLTPNDPVTTGGFSVTLATEVAGGALSVGVAKTVTASRAGQTTRLSYTGAVGQRFSLDFSSFTFPHNLFLEVYRPDGSLVFGDFLPTARVDLDPLTVAGAYQVVISPLAETGSVQLKFAERIDAGATAIGGAVKTLSVAQTGRIAETSFTATAGQRLDFGFTNWTFATGTQLHVRFTTPTGTILTEGSISNGGWYWIRAGVAGTYRMIVTPIGFGAGAVTVTASDQINAGTITLNTSRPSRSPERPRAPG